MELFEIQNMLRQNIKPKMLVFVGSDYAVANSYVNNLSKFYKLPIENLNSLANFEESCKGNEMFSHDTLYVLKYSKELTQYETMFENIEDILGENMLIIILLEIDKRTKFYKSIDKYVVNCEPQEFKVFKTMVENSTKMSSENIRKLAEICEFNLGKFNLELDKIKQFSEYKNISEDDALCNLIDSGVIYTGNRDVLFEFVNRVMSAKNTMYDSYSILKKQQESNIKLLSILYNSFRNQFICETVYQPTTETTGLTPYVISQCLKRRGIYSQADLRKALNLLRKLEQGIKSGLFEESSVIDYFMTELLL